MPKADLPQTSLMITKYNRLVQLYLQASKSGAEITELAGLQTELADYQIRASDYNLLNDNVSAVVTKTSEGAQSSATIKHGLNTINTTQASGAELTVQGKTLVNILGKDGNCESTTPFTTVGSASISTTQKRNGTNSIKVTGTDLNSYVWKDYAFTLDATKSYILGCWVFIESFTSGAVTLKMWDVGGFTNTRYTATAATGTIGSWQFVYVKIPTSNTLVGSGFRLQIGNGINSTLTAYIDEVRLYEVSSTDYTAIGTTYTATTTPSIDDFIPYVDSVQHSQGVAVRKTGKNMLPPFTQWTLHANAVLTEPYKLTLNATATGQQSSIILPVTPSTAYTASWTVLGSRWAVNYYSDVAGTVGAGGIAWQTALSATFTTPSNAASIKFYFDNNTTIGSLVFTNPQLELGSVATPFVERNDDYAYVSTILASNADRSVVDTYNSALGTVNRRFKTGVLLDGSLAWTFATDYTGYKSIQLVTIYTLATARSATITKYSGQILKNNQASVGTIADDHNGIATGGTLVISVSDVDSGWTETLNPNANAIKCLMNGWKANANNGTVYTSWVSVLDASSPTTNTEAYCAANKAPNWTGWATLDYQLATSVEETLTGDIGAISLHNGGNQLELLEGVVVREKANPQYDATNSVYQINYSLLSLSFLSKRAGVVLAVYKNGAIDNRWTIRTSDVNSNGTSRAFIVPGYYDTTAEYTVTYVTLDKYLYTANAIDTVVKYQSTLGSAVAKNVQDVADIKMASGAFSAHVAKTTAPVHGSTSAATPNTLMHRDANSQVNLGTPTASTHAATKGYVDTFAAVTKYTVNGARVYPATITSNVVNRMKVEVGNYVYHMQYNSANPAMVRLDTTTNVFTTMAALTAPAPYNGFSSVVTDGTNIYYAVYDSATSGDVYVYRYVIGTNTWSTWSTYDLSIAGMVMGQLAIDSTYLYFVVTPTGSGDWRVMRMALSDATQTIYTITGVQPTTSSAVVVNGYLHVSYSGNVRRIPLSTFNSNTTYSQNQSSFPSAVSKNGTLTDWVGQELKVFKVVSDQILVDKVFVLPATSMPLLYSNDGSVNGATDQRIAIIPELINA